MAQPVWVLSVDLQAKTATFQSGMAEAAKSARGAFQDIGSSAKKGMRDVEEGTVDVRHEFGLLDNSIRGNHAAAMADLIRLFQNTSTVMAALPIAGTIGGILLIAGTVAEAIKKFQEWRESGEKLKDDLLAFSTASNNTWDGMNERILQAEQKADELRNDHLAALKIQLQLIDHQSMGELVKSLEAVAKVSDGVFKDLQGNWYTFGIGSDGASHALAQFDAQYKNLLSQGKYKEASDLLHGTLESAQKVLALQKEAKANSGTILHTAGPNADTYAGLQAQLELKKYGVGFTEKEVKAQQQIVDALNAQVIAEGKRVKLKSILDGNATTQTGNEAGSRRAAAAKEAADSQLRMAQMAIAADKATASARLTIQHASIEERLKNDIAFADRERDTQLAANQAEIAALDKSGKDYANQLKTLNDKALEIQQQHETSVAELKAHAATEAAQRDLQTLQQSEREKIDVTDQGSAARLAAIDAAIKEEEGKHLQDTNFYRELLQQRVQATQQEAQEEKKIAFQSAEVQIRAREQAAQEEVRHRNEMGMIQQSSGAGVASLARLGLEQQEMESEYQIKRKALRDQLELYKQAGQEKIQQAKRTQLQLDLLDKQHTDRQKELEAQQVQALRSTWAQIGTGYASMFASVLEGHQSLTASLGRLADEAAGRMIAASLQVMAGNKSEQLSDAKTAAAGAYKAMSSIPVIGPELGAVAAAAVFAGAMAFNKGGIVPGVGNADTVPAMLTPGEGVVPGGVMDGLRNMAREGRMGGGGNVTHIHIRPTYNVQTIDGDGMQAALDKHTAVLQKHFEKTVRRMNR